MKLETLKVTWKFVRKAGYKSTRTPVSYCTYIAKNENHTHKLKTIDGTKLFNLLSSVRLSDNTEIHIDGVYRDDKLYYITNPRIV